MNLIEEILKAQISFMTHSGREADTLMLTRDKYEELRLCDGYAMYAYAEHGLMKFGGMRIIQTPDVKHFVLAYSGWIGG